MAFNPFANFAKYKRFWMGLTMILVMVTFVLCSGTKGDMADIFLNTFRFGRTAMFRIDGTSYYRDDFNKLQLQRKIANDYVAIYSRLLAEAVQERLRNPGDMKNQEEKEAFTRLGYVQEILALRRLNPKFFESPVPPEKGTGKAEDLIVFRTWLAEADRLGIHLQEKAVKDMLNGDLLKYHVAGQVHLDAIQSHAVSETMRNAGNERVSEQFLYQALENEYRVRIAQIAAAEFQIRTILTDVSPIKRLSTNPSFRPEQTRTPMSPGILWDYFKANRGEFNVALMPLPLTDFVAEIPEPDPARLQEMFHSGKKVPFDPASPTPGFLKPEQVKIQYVTVDANAPFYKKVVAVADALAQFPVGAFTPQMPLGTALTYVGDPMLFDSMIKQRYYTKIQSERQARIEYISGSLLDEPTQAPIVFLARRDPASIAAFIGAANPVAPCVESVAAASVPALLSRTALEKRDVVKSAVKSEFRNLVPVYATIVASGTMPTGLACAGELLCCEHFVGTMPFDLVKKEIQRDVDLRHATRIARANIALFKKELEKPHRIGDATQIKRELERWGPRKTGAAPHDGDYRDLGLEVVETDKLYDRYTIKDAPELKPLLESYQYYHTMLNQAEGRETGGAKSPAASGRGQPLKDDEFWRLFFDAEQFSAQKPYEPKPWPPVVKLGTPEQIHAMIKGYQRRREDIPAAVVEMSRRVGAAEPNKDVIFDDFFVQADRPFMFWKTQVEKPVAPKTLADVKDRVVLAWKMDQARDSKVFPYAKKLAESMMAGKADYKSVLKLTPYAGKNGDNIVVFDRLAPIYHDETGYGEYKLPRDTIRFPREDAVAQLLALGDLKEPIKILGTDKASDKPGDKVDKSDTVAVALDKLNEELFEFAKKNNKLGPFAVQILTNRPRDTFYVAVVEANHGVNRDEFYSMLRSGGQRVTFFEKAIMALGDERYRALVRQLRLDHRVELEDEAKKLDAAGGDAS